MTYGYARCSTNEDKRDINRQRRKLKELGINDSEIFFDYESGSKSERIQLKHLLSLVKSGDTIVTTEISRLAYSTKQLCEIIEIAREKKLELIIGTFKVDCRHDLDPMTVGMLKMMDVFAEAERKIISQRIKSGMENAKAQGAKIGRPRTTINNLPELFMKNVHLHTFKKVTQKELARLCGVSRQSIFKYIKIYEEAYAKHDVMKDFKDAEKFEAKEKRRLKSYKRWTLGELEAQAREEERDVEQDGISEFTPATKELERRHKKFMNQREIIEEKEYEIGEILNRSMLRDDSWLDEFDL